MLHRCFLLFLLFSLFSLFSLFIPSPATAETWPTLSTAPQVEAEGALDAALIIGIEDYLIVSDVLGAKQNADDWYQYLVESRRIPGENIELLRDNDASREMILKHAALAASKVRKGGTLWIVYIGHGAPSKDGKDGLFVGVDAQQTAASLYARSLSQRELIETISGGKQSQTMMVVDACFSGKVGDGRMLVQNLQPLLLVDVADSPVTILSAGSGGEFAGSLPGISRPAFSYLVLGAMRGWGDENQDRTVTAREATTYARSVIGRVVKDRMQTPQLRGPNTNFALSRGAGERGPNITKMVLEITEPTHVKVVPVPDGGQLEIMYVSPSTVTVLINGQEQGIAPNQFLDLPLGKVNITLRAPGYQDHTASITLTRGKLTELGRVQLKVLPAMLAVSANISGASIKVNGKKLGTTVGGRVVELEVPPGVFTVSVERKGYKSRKERRTLLAGRKATFEVDLEIIREVAPEPPSPPMSSQTIRGGLLLGTGSLLFIGGIGARLSAVSKRNDIVYGSGGVTEAEAQSLQDGADDMDAIAVVLWSAGSAIALVGGYFLWADEETPAVQVNATITDQLMMLNLGGHF